MEGRVDFPLDRGRLLAPALPPGTLGPLGSTYGDSSSLGRAGVSDITRTDTPSTLSGLGHYPSRFVPPAMSMSQGTGFALMGGYLSGASHAPEGLKSLMPDVQQYWGHTHPEGYHRYVINNNMYPPYPFQIGAESLPLLPGAMSATSAQPSSFGHRIYELHQDPYLTGTSAAVAQGGYFSLPGNPSSIPSRPSSPQAPGIVFKQETQYEPPVLPERASKHSEKRSHTKCESNKTSDSRSYPKHESIKTSDCRYVRGDIERTGVRSGEMADPRVEKDSHKTEKSRVKKLDNSEGACKKSKVPEIHDHGEKHKTSSVEKHSDKSSSARTSISTQKTQITTPLPTVTVTASGTVASHSASVSTGSTQSGYTSGQPVAIATTQGAQATVSTVNTQGKAVSSLPYYHNMYSHTPSNSPPAQGPRKVFATTFVPEIGTVGGPLEKSLSKVCEGRVKTETVRTSCSREKHTGSASKVVSCPPSTESSRTSEHPSKHSSKSSKSRPLDESKASHDDPQRNSPVSSTVDPCIIETPKQQHEAHSKEYPMTDKACETGALDFTTSTSKSGRVCAKHQVKSLAKPVTSTNTAVKVEQKVSAQVQPSVSNVRSCLGDRVTSSSPVTKPDSTTPQDNTDQEETGDKHETQTKREVVVRDSALNLTKSRKSRKGCERVTKGKGRLLPLRKTDIATDTEKRCGSVISSSQEGEEEEELDPGTEQTDGHTDKAEECQEHTGGNIPVGIAVARQRTEPPRKPEPRGCRPQAPPIEGVARVEEDDPAMQYSQDREEFLRQQKALLSGQVKVTVNTGLPPNLVVTGSVNGSDPGLQDDVRLRPLASQWLAAGHTVNPNPWMNQNAFALHPSITTTSTATLDPNPFGVTVPSGFKIAQDSFTGNLFLIPADYVDQSSSMWPFSGSHSSQPPPTHFQQLLQTSNASHLAQITAPGSPLQLHVTPGKEIPDNASGGRQTPDSGDQQDGSGRESDTGCGSRIPTPGSTPKSVTVKEKSPLPQSPPPTPGSPHKPINLSNPYIPDMTVAQQYAYPYTAGHLPLVFNHGLLPVQGMPVNLSEPLTVKTEPPSVQSRGTSPMVLTPPPSDEVGRVEPTFREVAVYADFPKTVTKCCASVQTCDFDRPPAPSVTLKEQCSQTCHELGWSKTETLLIAAEKISKMTDCGSQSDFMYSFPSCSNVDRTRKDLNLFADPSIIQAADGLELLSTLAERRSKCSPSPAASRPVIKSPRTSKSKTTPPRHLPPPSPSLTQSSPISTHRRSPSPSDSFKSECTTATEASSVDVDKSRDVTPKRDVRRCTVSPKWTFTKKDTNSSGFTLPTGLESMDAMELEMRMRLAELQRRYKEKQKELAKLQPKSKDGIRERRDSRESRDDDKNSEKRKPGRPRKRKFFSQKKEDELTGKSGIKDSHPKKKRLPEELVDRVFRKLPPAKADKLKSMRSKSGFYMKRRTTSTSKLISDASSNSEVYLCKSSTFVGDRKFFKTKAGNIATGKFKPFAKRRDDTIKFENATVSLQTTSDTGNLFSNIENSLVEKKRPKTMLKGSDRHRPKQASDLDTSSPQAVSPSMLESGLGLLAKFATSALTSANIKRNKRETEEASDTETSDTQSSNKKRKPGRPKKCSQESGSGCGTETIVAKSSKTLGLLHMSEVSCDLSQSNTDKKNSSQKQGPRQIKLDTNPQMKPLYLDDEWCRRRSERIFLSEPSPQPSPNNQTTPGKQEVKAFFTPRSNKTQTDKDRAKVQKAKSLQELSQKVKRKYSKNMNKKASFEDRLSRGSIKSRIKSRSIIESESDPDSGSDGDDIPLSALRRRPETPEPRSCVMQLDDLNDGLRVLEFQDGLFYEGAVKALNPPDIYGVVVDNQRGNRPHIYPQEEILNNVIVDVKPSSPRSLSEGTRVCAYWSQQFSCLYPGTVAKTSPNPHADKFSVNVEFDDGDSGRIPLDHIRLLPTDFPLVVYDPNPLLNLSKRRRRTISDDSELRKSSEGYFSLCDVSKKRNSKRDTFSDQFDETLEEDVFETDVRKKSQSRDHSPRSGSGDCGQKTPLNKDNSNSVKSQYGKGFPGKEGRAAPSQSPRREDLKTSSILRPSAFDMKKLGFQYGGDDHDEESSSDEDVDSSEDDNNDDSGDHCSDSASPDDDSDVETKKNGKSSKTSSTKKRHKSSGFLQGRQFWSWSGKSTKRPGLKGKAKKEFYKAIIRGQEEIKVGDCAVFLSTGRPNLPFIGRIDSMWEAWGGQMTVKVKWFYHPEETKGGKKLTDPKGALFESPHEDENDVQTISHKCEVQTVYDFKKRRSDAIRKGLTLDEVADVYYLAGFYDPTIGHVKYEPDVL